MLVKIPYIKMHSIGNDCLILLEKDIKKNIEKIIDQIKNLKFSQFQEKENISDFACGDQIIENEEPSASIVINSWQDSVLSSVGDVGGKIREEMIIAMCNRTRGIGADQLIIIDDSDVRIEKSEKPKFHLKIYNMDGSEAGSCFNGSRCAAHYLIKKYKKSIVYLNTKDGPIKAVGIGSRRNMQTLLEIDFISRTTPKIDPILEKEIYFEGIDKIFSVSFGNKHLVVFAETIQHLKNNKWILNALENLDKYLRNKNSKEFFQELKKNKDINDSKLNFKPIGSLDLFSNIHFCYQAQKQIIQTRCFEKGVGETQACGSGAAAIFLIASNFDLLEESQDKIKEGCAIRMPGGDLWLQFNGKNKIEIAQRSSIIARGVFYNTTNPKRNIRKCQQVVKI